tara:strand:+ start:260 stop:439 length:180 start_codon:yes stop_codon:yes gene_type:complete
MADIKTITTELNETGSYLKISSSISDEETRTSDSEIMTTYLLIKKIDELVEEVNTLKNQ